MIVGCALTELDGLVAVSAAGNDHGLLCDPPAGHDDVFGSLDPLAQIERLALLRIGGFRYLLVQGFAVLAEGGVFRRRRFGKRGVGIADIVVLAESLAIAQPGVADCALPRLGFELLLPFDVLLSACLLYTSRCV